MTEKLYKCSNLKVWKEVIENTGNVLLKESVLPVFLHGYEDMKTAFL